jgi:hypothetical protein
MAALTTIGHRTPSKRGRCPIGETHKQEPLTGPELLEGNGGASLFEGSLRLVSGLLVCTLEHNAGSAVNDSLGLAESETGKGANLLDDLDLLVTDGLEDDVELRLLLNLFGGGSSSSGAGNGDGSSSGDLEDLFELLYEVAELDERELLECFDELVI